MSISADAPAHETIFAPASGIGRAAICVVRLSGPGTAHALEALAGALPEPRRMSLRTLRDPHSGEPLDSALVVFFPGPASFTGEDMAELHVHGGVATRAGVLAALSRLPGLRLAEPGEMTRRAFLGGRMDLAEVEGLADLIDAQTRAQARQALRQLSRGGIGARAQAWRERLVAARATIEAAIDFSDEGDVPVDVAAGLGTEAGAIADAMRAALADGRRGERLREGFVVVLAGPPNASKSTLVNALARRDVAIVSPIAGTTRDAIEVSCDLGGLPVTLIDTAGLRETQDAVEAIGVARTRARIGEADLVVWLDPADAPAPPDPDLAAEGAVLHVRAKADLAGAGAEAGAPARDAIALSAATGEGIDALLARIEEIARAAMGDGSDALVTRERHRVALERAAEALDRARTVLDAAGALPTELAAEDLRLATRALESVIGRVDVEDVLDALFASFCIGK
ncbi:tRNA uridine-5-carboxymethylaminomethyl(34) synthesis GTPase MnmE [Salinarimonas sp.]|uniref:tRNA uridine-5-carboxymethylaminomethyl(34) synthesis GTPase MnmE n=1 Tax=Salinarimonas sp. TaxID=2766526 RepID=UPI003919C829